MTIADAAGGGLRLASGGDLIDRATPVAFAFDGVRYTGFRGDTLASALLANAVTIVGRSIYDDRPRGIMTAGSDEPTALVRLRTDTADEPMVRATQAELADELEAWSQVGLGRLAPEPDRGRFDATHAHCETLVVGAGTAGLAAALEAGRAGDRVILVDEGPSITIGNEISALADVRILPRATALGIYDHGYVIVAERQPTERTEGRLWRIRARTIVLATGALERPIVFAGNDRPGVMLASAAATYINRFGVMPGRRAVVFTTNDSTASVVSTLERAGVDVAAVVDTRRDEAIVATGAHADGRLASVTIGRLDGSGPHRTVATDVLLVSGGWNPNVNLWSQSQGTLRYDTRIAAFVPDQSLSAIRAVGAAAGEGLPTVDARWLVPPADHDAPEAWSTHYIDLQRDATVAHLQRAMGAGLTSIEHIKRYTTIGTAADQGKTSGVVASAIAAAILGQEVGAVGVPTYRPPYTPITFGAVAGRERGRLLDPIRTTPIHPWHVRAGAVFEDVGQWKRPRYFPREGESMDAAVQREAIAARTGVAVMDASTLGKIDLHGPDVGVFLDRVYTNRHSTLPVGSCRYGVMCRLDGMVLDDGVSSRIAQDRFLITTTTGNAATVMDHLEEYLQTEWPDLQVRATSVTEQWATIAIVGPCSRDVIAGLAPGLEVGPEAFPFMTWRDTSIGSVPARVARISFSGELAFEISVASWHGLELWEAVMAVGQPHGITAYGTETLHVLRAEKGYPIIGQETDGTVTPDDLGLSWAVAATKDFIGRRSLRRPDLTRPDRLQLVGLFPCDPDVLMPEGSQLVAHDADLARIPVPMLGHVTSSYRSAILGRTFAMALVSAGRSRIGQVVRAPLPDGVIDAVIVDPVVVDPESRRRDGDPRMADSLEVGRVESAALPTVTARSPLHGLPMPDGVHEIPFQTQLQVRVDAADAAAVGRLGSALGISLPTGPNTVSTSADGATRAIWLGPDEWLIVGPTTSVLRQPDAIATAMRGAGQATVTDVSASRTIIALEGRTARGLLEHGCSIDLHPRSFQTGMSAQTLVARTNVILLQVAETPTYWLLVRPSFAGHLAAWLEDASDA